MNIQDLLPLFTFEFSLPSIWRSPWPQDLPTVLSTTLSRLTTTLVHWTEDLLRTFTTRCPTRIPSLPPTPTSMEVAKVPLSSTLITTLVVVLCVVGTPVILLGSRSSLHPPKETTSRMELSPSSPRLRLKRLSGWGPLNAFEVARSIRDSDMVLSASFWLQTHIFTPFCDFSAVSQPMLKPLFFAMSSVAPLTSHIYALSNDPLVDAYYPFILSILTLISLMAIGEFSWARAIAIFGPNFSPQIFSLLLEVNFRLMSRTNYLVRYSTYSFNAFSLALVIFSAWPHVICHALGSFAQPYLFPLAFFFGHLAIQMDIVDCVYLLPQRVLTRRIRVYQDARFTTRQLYRFRTRRPYDHLPLLMILFHLFLCGPSSLNDQSALVVYLSIICTVCFYVRLGFWAHSMCDDNLIVHERLAEVVVDPFPFFFRRQPDLPVQPPANIEPNIVARYMHNNRFETRAMWGVIDIVNKGDPDVPMGIG